MKVFTCSLFNLTDDVMYGDDDDLYAFFHNTKRGMCTSSPDKIRGIILHVSQNTAPKSSSIIMISIKNK